MKNMTLANIAACLKSPVCNGKGKEHIEITGAVLDSRKAEPGNLFFATKGERVDGHDFIAQVAKKGAALVVCEKAPEVDIPYIVVEDSFWALKEVAKFYRGQLTIPVIGVTGSVGKTSTKEMIAACLSAKYRVLKTEGNFNNEVGLPLTVLRIRDEHEVAVIEMGISDFGEMSRLADIAKPDISVITNIGICHLENLKDRDGVLKAKTEVFDYMQANGCAILNGDDDKLSMITEVCGRKPLFFGVSDSTSMDAVALDVQSKGLFGSDYTMRILGDEVRVSVPLPGKHMVTNALAAALVGSELGMTTTQIVEGIASVKATGGRSNILQASNKVIIDDCYNANPISMKSAIDLLKMAQGKKVAILGDMFELGANELALHSEVGQYATMAMLDKMIFIGNLSKEMYEGAMKLHGTPEYYKDKEGFFAKYKPTDFKDTTVLVKASHGMHFEEIVEWLKEA